MSLKQWADNGWLKSHYTTRQEIENLLGIVERDLLIIGTGRAGDAEYLDNCRMKRNVVKLWSGFTPRIRLGSSHRFLRRRGLGQPF